MHGISGYYPDTAGAYLDSFSNYTVIEQNVIYHAAEKGSFLQHWGTGNNITSCLFILIPDPRSKCASGAFDCSGVCTEPSGYGRSLWPNDFTFTSNVLYAPSSAQAARFYNPDTTAADLQNCTIDANVYFAAGRSPALPDKLTVSEWRSGCKHDQRSLFDADPMLTLSDAGGGLLNISMDDASPALRPEIGFRRWDWTRVGPRTSMTSEARRNEPGTAASDVMMWWSIEVDSPSDTIADSLRRTAEASANLSLSKFGRRDGAASSPTISFSPFQVDYDVSIDPHAAPIVRLSKQASYADGNVTQDFASLLPLRRFGPLIVPLSVGGSCDPDTNRSCLADLTAFLTSPARRAAAVAELAQIARTKGFAGYNLDQETQMPYSVGNVSAALTAGWRSFLVGLASSMRDVDPAATVSADLCGNCGIADYMGMVAADWAGTGVEIASMCTYSNDSAANYTPPGGSSYNPFDGYLACLADSYGEKTARVGLGQGIPTWNTDVGELKRQLRKVEGAGLTKVAIFEAPSPYTSVEWLNVLYDWVAARK